MGYRDDFYVVANIIGYTGSINDHPTVYFESLGEYGRITQAHDNPLNVGRNKVRSNEGHSMANENYRGKLRCVERQGGQVTHASRNPFIAVAGLSQGDKDILAQAILNFEEKKAK